MRYIDMKIAASADLTVAGNPDNRVYVEFAKLAASIYVKQAAERKTQELSGVVPPVVFVPRGTATPAPFYDVLVREDAFDQAVTEELKRLNLYAEQLAEGFTLLQKEVAGCRYHRANVPDNSYGTTDNGQEGSICSGSGGAAQTEGDQLQS